MQKPLSVLLLVLLALAATATVAHAERIIVRTLEVGSLNITVQGRITFEEPARSIRVVCDKTMSGQLNETTEGRLGLGGNTAGSIKEIRLAGCEGGTATTLVRLSESASWVALHWLRAERTGSGPVELAGRNANFQINAGVPCLYTASLVASGEDTRGNRRYERLSLALLRGGLRLNRRFEELGQCPSGERDEVRMIGTLTLVRPPAVEIRLEV